MEPKGSGGASVQITGNRSVVVDGCDGIVDYDEEKVILRMGRLTVQFLGRGLRLVSLTEHSAVIEGFLDGVEYGT